MAGLPRNICAPPGYGFEEDQKQQGGVESTDSWAEFNLKTILEATKDAPGEKDANKQGGAKADFDLMTNFQETVEARLQGRNADPEVRPITNNWSHPHGKNQPALVLVMNLCVEDTESDVYLPGEIAVCTFTIENGLDPIQHYWSLVDPASKVPKGNNLEAFRNFEEMGVPYLDRSGYSTKFQNYPEIVETFEKFVKEDRGAEPVSGLGHLIFCLKDNIHGYKKALEWLYRQAGRKFQHKLMPLEALLVTLSMGGLECLAEMKTNKFSTDDTFLEVLKSFCRTVSKAQSYVSKQGCIGLMEQREIRKNMETFSTTQTYSENLSQYSSIGSSTATRIASQRFNFPDAFLGAILLEEQAARYFQHLDYLHMSELACEYHQEKMQGLPPDLTKKAKRMALDKKPCYKSQNCALINARKMIYQALDVMLVNYQYHIDRVVEGRHYPKE